MDDDDLADMLRHERRERLLEPTVSQGATLTHERARQHLMEGYNRRVLMLRCSIDYVYAVAEESEGKPLSAFAVPELAIHVNSIWLNICGALDNLAWALAYELGFLPGLAEGHKEGRDSIGLAKPAFLSWLNSLEPVLGDQLHSYQPWLTELRDLRDPAAHRIPLYPIPGLLQGTAAEQAKELFDKAGELMRTGRLSEGLQLVDQGYSLGLPPLDGSFARRTD